MKKKLTVIHGDKGGIGKSTFAFLHADFLLDRFRQIVIVEGDKKISDVADRFGAVPGVHGILANLARPDMAEEAIIALFEQIEGLGDAAGHVIVNTPGSVSDTLDKKADLFVPTARALGYEIHVAWMVGDDAAGIALSQTSALCAEADRKVAIINAHKTDPKRGQWASSAARSAWVDSGGLEAVLPALTDRAATILREHPHGRVSDLAKPEGGQTIVIRQVFHNWVRAAWEGPCAVLDGE